MMDHDPIRDEDKKYSLYEFVAIVVADALRFQTNLEGINDFMRGRHTHKEWWDAFTRWKSW